MARKWAHGSLVAVVALLLSLVVAAQQDGAEDQAKASEFFDELQSAPYTEWDFQPGVPAGYYVGVEPHGMILRVLINDVAAGDLANGASEFSEGAFLVKENHMPEGVDISGLDAQASVEGFEGNLAALTYMVKVPGYNPEAGDWFWANADPGGTINAAGKAEMCISCHAQVADNDFVFNSKLQGN